MEEARSGKNLRGNRRGLRVPSSFFESNYPLPSYRVAHVLSGNRPRGKWKSKKLAANAPSNVKLLRNSREIVTDPFLCCLFGRIFTPLLPTWKRDTVSIHSDKRRICSLVVAPFYGWIHLFSYARRIDKSLSSTMM